MKRIVVCMDGTWQSLRQDKLTNIGVIARSIGHTDTRGAEPVPQIVIYTQGVGSTVTALPDQSLLADVVEDLTQFAGGAFGDGLEDGIVDTYIRVAFNYEAGDEIYIFGFSRGAFAARRLAGFINAAGIVSRRHVDKAWMGFRIYLETPRGKATDEARAEHAKAAEQFRRLYGKGGRNPDGTRRQILEPPPITYLGVFDTVVQRGAGNVLAAATIGAPKRSTFGSLHVSPNVQSARHAVAIDECRLGFPSTPWEGLDEANAAAHARPGADPNRLYFDQRWFVGMHGDVGGGEGSPLAALPLKWITDGAAAQGLRFYGTHGNDRSPLDDVLHHARDAFDGPITRPTFFKAFQPMNWPLRARKIWTEKSASPSLTDVGRFFHSSVLRRAQADHLRYRPGALRPFRALVREAKTDA